MGAIFNNGARWKRHSAAPRQMGLDEMPGMEQWGHAEIQTPPALIPSRPAP